MSDNDEPHMMLGRGAAPHESIDNDSTTAVSDFPVAPYRASNSADFDFKEAREHAIFVIRSARGDEAFVPSNDDITALVLRNHERFLNMKVDSERQTRKRERSPDLISCVQGGDVSASGLKLGNVSVIHLALVHTDTAKRLTAFEKAFDDVVTKVMSVRTGNSEDHPVARHNDLHFRTLKLCGRSMLEAVKSPSKDPKWCCNAREWQYNIMGQVLAVRHSVPAMDALSVVDYCVTKNDFKVDTKLGEAEGVRVFYNNLFNYANTSFSKWHNAVKSGALEREKADRSNPQHVSRRNRSDFRETPNAAQSKNSNQKKWQSGGTNTRT